MDYFFWFYKDDGFWESAVFGFYFLGFPRYCYVPETPKKEPFSWLQPIRYLSCPSSMSHKGHWYIRLKIRHFAGRQPDLVYRNRDNTDLDVSEVYQAEHNDESRFMEQELVRCVSNLSNPLFMNGKVKQQYTSLEFYLYQKQTLCLVCQTWCYIEKGNSTILFWNVLFLKIPYIDNNSSKCNCFDLDLQLHYKHHHNAVSKQCSYFTLHFFLISISLFNCTT